MFFALFIIVNLLFPRVYADQEQFGPFDMIFYNFGSCLELRNPKIYLGMKPKKISRTLTAIDTNITNSVPFDDSLHTFLVGSELTSRGVYKESYATEFPRTCSAFKIFLPEIYNAINNELNRTTGEEFCHLLPGSRVIRNIVLKPTSVALVKTFWYKKLKVKSMLKKGGKAMGCFVMNIDIVPKRKNKKQGIHKSATKF